MTFKLENIDEIRDIHLKNLFKKNIISSATKISKDDNYIKGKFYYSSYHQKMYKVLNIYPKLKGCPVVEVLWEDGNITNHMTSLDPNYDYILEI